MRLLRDWLLLSVFALVLALDQLSKDLIRTYLHVGASFPREGLLRITHVTNTGSAFGLFPNQTLFLILASFVGIGVILHFYRSAPQPGRLLRLSLGLQLGGALGNLIDRLRVGYVVDFIDLGWWPVFNLADSAIVVGITVLALVFLPGKSRTAQAEVPPTPGGTTQAPLHNPSDPPLEPPGQAG